MVLSIVHTMLLKQLWEKIQTLETMLKDWVCAYSLEKFFSCWHWGLLILEQYSILLEKLLGRTAFYHHYYFHCRYWCWLEKPTLGPLSTSSCLKYTCFFPSLSLPSSFSFGRHKLDSCYKSNRKPMDPSLRRVFPSAKDILSELKIFWVCVCVCAYW